MFYTSNINIWSASLDSGLSSRLLGHSTFEESSVASSHLSIEAKVPQGLSTRIVSEVQSKLTSSDMYVYTSESLVVASLKGQPGEGMPRATNLPVIQPHKRKNGLIVWRSPLILAAENQLCVSGCSLFFYTKRKVRGGSQWLCFLETIDTHTHTHMHAGMNSHSG